MPVAFRLYLPVSWVEDRERRKKTGVPDSAQFQTKPEIALEQIRRARERGLPEGVVLADAGYGTDTKFRSELTKLEMTYVVGVQSTTSVWKPGERTEAGASAQRQHWAAPQTASTRCEQPTGLGERTCAVTTCRNLEESDVEARGEAEIAVTLCRHTGASRASRLLALSTASGRIGCSSNGQPGNRNPPSTGCPPCRPDIGLRELVHLAKHRWIIERDYQELKQELGLGHYEGRGWRGVSSSRHLMYRGLWIPGGRTESFFPLSPRRQSRITNPRTAARLPAAWFAAFVPSGIIRDHHYLRMVLARHLIGGIAQCPFCGSRSG